MHSKNVTSSSVIEGENIPYQTAPEIVQLQLVWYCPGILSWYYLKIKFGETVLILNTVVSLK